MKTGRVLRRFRHAVLVSFGISLVLIAAATVGGILVWANRISDHRVSEVTNEIAEHWQSHIAGQSALMGSTLAAIAANPDFADAFLAGNHPRLMNAAAPLFADLKLRFGITHLYFIDPARRVFLRAHQPEKTGDTVSRTTLAAAAAGGREIAGLEVGPLGTFTLRLVRPWVWQERMIGYLELGINIERLIAGLRPPNHSQAVLFLSKTAVPRDLWEPNRPEQTPFAWSRFDDILFAGGTVDEVETINEAARHLDRTADRAHRLPSGRLMTRPLPLVDASQRVVGWMAGLFDDNEVRREAWQTVLVLGVLIQVIALGTFVVTRLVLGRIDHLYTSASRERLHFEALSQRDGLTNLYNRRAFNLILDQQLGLARRTKAPIALIMIDIDRFKDVNDRHGHLNGDSMLCHVAGTIRATLRAHDVVARYGGEEFVAILPGLTAAEAHEVAERVRCQIVATPLVLPGSPATVIPVTVSVGLAVPAGHDQAPTDLVAAADRALYAAKNGGRNQVCLAG